MAEMNAIDRVQAAIRCEKPDCVPIIPMMDFFCARYKGVKLEDYINDWDLARDLAIEVFKEFGGWDYVFASTSVTEFAFALTLPIRLKVPGRELPSDTIWQFDEMEIIQVEDYDFAIEHGFEALSAQLFPRIRPRWNMGQFGDLMNQFMGQTIKDTHIWESMNVPAFSGVAIVPPLDFFSMGRSLKEFSTDLFRRPDKVLAAMDAITPGLIASAIGGMKGISQATRWGFRCNFIGATRGSGSFISPKMFEKFNWPFIKRIALAELEAGITPLFHFDSDWTPMLEFFKDLPKGTCVLELDSLTDIFKAKKVLGGHMCLMGDVPAALLKLGTTDEVKAYVRRLCEEVGDSGGYILSTGCDAPVDAKPENMRVMIEAAKTYGVYH
jgi:uroporphyrinogen-III decarboxylase